MLTYDEFINDILEKRGRFECGDEYCERHHIIPRCLGGTDDIDNLIDLFASEHFIAHKLLAEENPYNNSLIYAWACMTFAKGEHIPRPDVSPEEYEAARIALGKVVGESNKKRKWSDESKEKVRKKMTGDKNPMYGKPWWYNSTPDRVEEWKKKRSENSIKIPVVQLTKEGNFVAEYASVREASEATGIFEPNIIQVYNHTPHRKSAGGYKWIKKEEYLMQKNN